MTDIQTDFPHRRLQANKRKITELLQGHQVFALNVLQALKQNQLLTREEFRGFTKETDPARIADSLFNYLQKKSIIGEEEYLVFAESLLKFGFGHVVRDLNQSRIFAELENALKLLAARQRILLSTEESDVSYATHFDRRTYRVILEKAKKDQEKPEDDIDYLTSVGNKIGVDDESLWTLEDRDQVEMLKGRCTLLAGVPGSGKTTFCGKLISLFLKRALPIFRNIIFIPLKFLPDINKSYSLLKFEELTAKFKQKCAYDMEHGDPSQLIILDGFDELVLNESYQEYHRRAFSEPDFLDDERSPFSWLHHLLVSSNHSVILTTRNYSLPKLKNYHFGLRLKLLGFTDASIQKMFQDNELESEFEVLKKSPHIYIQLFIPVTCAMIIRCMKESHEPLFESQTEMFMRIFILQICQHHRIRGSNISEDCIKEELKNLFKLKSEGRRKEDVSVTKSIRGIFELSRKVVDHQFKYETQDEEEIGFGKESGMMVVDEHPLQTFFGCKVWLSPVHNTLVEFAAACAAVLTIVDAVNVDKGAKACDGILKKKSKELDSRSKTPVVACFFCCLMDNYESKVDKQLQSALQNNVIVHEGSLGAEDMMRVGVEINLRSKWFKNIIKESKNRLSSSVRGAGNTLDMGNAGSTKSIVQLALLNKVVASGFAFRPTQLTINIPSQTVVDLVCQNENLQKSVEKIVIITTKSVLDLRFFSKLRSLSITCIYDPLTLVMILMSATDQIEDLTVANIEKASRGESPAHCGSPTGDHGCIIPDLTKFKQILKIEFVRVKFSDGIIEKLSRADMGNLQTLVLKSCDIRFGKEFKLHQLKSLKYVNFSDNPIDNWGLFNLLQSCPDTLSFLDVSNCQISFASEIPDVAEYLCLEYISVNGNRDLRENDVHIDNFLASLPPNIRAINAEPIIPRLRKGVMLMSLESPTFERVEAVISEKK